MKESLITSALVKSKMSGYEVGRLMIQGHLFELKQLREGAKKIQDLLNPQEVEYVQRQLTDSHDIKVYNSCRRLLEYLASASSLAEITRKEIEIAAFRMYFLISNEMKAEELRRRLSNDNAKGEIVISAQEKESLIGLVNIELGDSKIPTVLHLYNEFIRGLELWLIFQEAFRLISERMDLPDLMIMIGGEPVNQIGLVNAIVKDLQFLCPENKISRAFFDKGIGDICGDDEVPQSIDVIDIEKLRPAAERISAAKEVISDLTYFSKNWGIHNILGLEAEIE